MSNYEIIPSEGRPIKAWTRGVDVDEKAKGQLRNLASLPYIHKHVAVMPDAHWGMGSTVGSVIATKRAIIPAAVGEPCGCFENADRDTDSAFGPRGHDARDACDWPRSSHEAKS